MARFGTNISLDDQTRVLDVGGYPWAWNGFRTSSKITILNVHSVDYPPQPGDVLFEYVVGDGTRLDYPDGAFDVVFSNSVIEHLGTIENQEAFARECRRVGRNLWIQTPARSFFIEPHLLTPFIHFLPRSWQQLLLRNFTVWGLITRPSANQVSDWMAEVRLLDRAEFSSLFPDCEILAERFLGMTKSYIALRRTERPPVARQMVEASDDRALP